MNMIFKIFEINNLVNLSSVYFTKENSLTTTSIIFLCYFFSFRSMSYDHLVGAKINIPTDNIFQSKSLTIGKWVYT